MCCLRVKCTQVESADENVDREVDVAVEMAKPLYTVSLEIMLPSGRACTCAATKAMHHILSLLSSVASPCLVVP